jgi:hypothetical protein
LPIFVAEIEIDFTAVAANTDSNRVFVAAIAGLGLDDM